MRRARALSLLAIATILVAGPGGPTATRPDVSNPVAAVSWPASSGLLIAELVTGGASASDEFVEIANISTAPLELAGVELAYVSSSGATLTRKASWTSSRPLASGQRLLLANNLGAFAAAADVTYSGGLAATGGSLVLRLTGGAVIDAVGWGDAVNGYVEGVAAPAPPSGASIERRPGGSEGNTRDTNDNVSDFIIQVAPRPEGLTAPPMPLPSPAPSPSAEPTPGSSPEPTAEPTESPSVEPTVPPTPSPTPSPIVEPTAEPSAVVSPAPEPTAAPTPQATVEPTLEPTSSPSAEPTVEPTPEPTASATPTPTATPTPSVAPTPAPIISVSSARGLPDGGPATIEATLTTTLGALESGRSTFVQDATAGISLWLPSPPAEAWPAGTLVRAQGTVDDRYGQRTLRVATDGLVLIGTAGSPQPAMVPTGTLGEGLEGSLVMVEAAISGVTGPLADGLGIDVDDGSGTARAVIGPAALASFTLSGGDRVRLVGPLGQRDSTGTGTTGYRLLVTEAGSLTVLEPAPTPTPEPSPSPTPTPEPLPSGSPAVSPEPSATGTPSVSPLPTPTPGPADAIPVAEARRQAIGSDAIVAGTVTIEPDRVGSPNLSALQDASGGIVIHLPGDAGVHRGDWIVARGELADPYGQLELRIGSGDIRVLACAPDPDPLPVEAADIGEGLEGRLVILEGTRDGSVTRGSSGDLAVTLRDASDGRIRVMVDASLGLTPGAFPAGVRFRVVGVVGQRATAKGKLDGYRVWLRDTTDLIRVSSPSLASPSVSPRPSTTEAPLPLRSIATARRLSGRVRVGGVVIAGSGLLDADGRKVVIDDGTAGLMLLLPAGARASTGERVVAEGEMGTSLGAPRLAVMRLESAGPADPPEAIELRSAPSERLEWRLVRASGRLAEVHRLGERWTADLLVEGRRILVSGLAGASIDPAQLVVGRLASVTGIVRRPAPTALDRRFSVTPRSPADVSVTATPGGANAAPGADSGTAGASTGDGPPLVDLVDLGRYVGRDVRVSGLVVAVDGQEVALDDGTARATLVLWDDAAAFLPLLEPGDPLAATGRVGSTAEGTRLTVTDASSLVRGAALAPASSAASVGVASAMPTPIQAGSGGAATIGFPDPGTVAGAGSLIGVSLMSIAATIVRRRRSQRLLAERVAARLQTLAGGR